MKRKHVDDAPHAKPGPLFLKSQHVAVLMCIVIAAVSDTDAAKVAFMKQQFGKPSPFDKHLELDEVCTALIACMLFHICSLVCCRTWWRPSAGTRTNRWMKLNAIVML